MGEKSCANCGKKCELQGKRVWSIMGKQFVPIPCDSWKPRPEVEKP